MSDPNGPKIYGTQQGYIKKRVGEIQAQNEQVEGRIKARRDSTAAANSPVRRAKKAVGDFVNNLKHLK